MELELGNRMDERRQTLSRRDFMVRSTLTAGAVLAGGIAEAEAPKAKVIVVTTKADIGAGKPIPFPLVQQMIEKGVTALAGKSDPMQAWATYVRASDSVGLPTAGGQMESIPEVNAAVYLALMKLGVNKMNIGTHRMSSTWKKSVTDLMGDKAPQFITGKLFGIADLTNDSLVVLPTVKHHDVAGVSAGLKLYACFSKKGPWNYHGETPKEDPRWDGKSGGSMGACGWVPANEYKTTRKLHIIDMIRVGGSSRGFTAWPDGWVYTKSLVFSTDPVAADRVALDMYLKVAQPSGRLDPLYHIERADKEYKAGDSDLAKIDVRRITV